MKRQSSVHDASSALPMQRTKSNWNSNKEVVAASAVPSMDTVMSSHVRYLCETMPNNNTGLWGYWGKMAIPGTKIANAIGLNTFPGGDPITLYKLLFGYIEAEPMDEKGQANVAYGIEHESRARALYCLVLGNLETCMHDRTMSFLYPWINYGCDGHANGYSNPWAKVGQKRTYLIEIKCPAGKPYETIPLNYMVQIQTGMAVHGMSWCDFIMYTKKAPEDVSTASAGVPIEHIKVWRVQFNPECWQLILTRLVYFMNCLHTDTPPETDFMLSPAVDRSFFESPVIVTNVIIDQDVVFPDDSPVI
jgi:hypothetical protein